jgi:hypothetical protein
MGPISQEAKVTTNKTDPERIARIKWIMATDSDERREALVWLSDHAPDVFAAVQRHITIKRTDQDSSANL